MLEVKHVSKSFGPRRVLHAISLNVERGAAVALSGPSGSGKTTLLRIIAGLESLEEGEVLIGGTCVSSREILLPPERRQIGMVFQDLALWPHLRAWRHLEFVLRGRGLSRATRVDRARSLLDTLGLAHRTEAYPAALSGGEQQRLALARALITEPQLLLLDEPLANLDTALRAQVMGELLRRMKIGVAVVIATHDAGEVEQLSAARVPLSN